MTAEGSGSSRMLSDAEWIVCLTHPMIQCLCEHSPRMRAWVTASRERRIRSRNWLSQTCAEWFERLAELWAIQGQSIVAGGIEHPGQPVEDVLLAALSARAPGAHAFVLEVADFIRALVVWSKPDPAPVDGRSSFKDGLLFRTVMLLLSGQWCTSVARLVVTTACLAQDSVSAPGLRLLFDESDSIDGWVDIEVARSIVDQLLATERPGHDTPSECSLHARKLLDQHSTEWHAEDLQRATSQMSEHLESTGRCLTVGAVAWCIAQAATSENPVGVVTWQRTRLVSELCEWEPRSKDRADGGRGPAEGLRLRCPVWSRLGAVVSRRHPGVSDGALRSSYRRFLVCVDRQGTLGAREAGLALVDAIDAYTTVLASRCCLSPLLGLRLFQVPRGLRRAGRDVPGCGESQAIRLVRSVWCDWLERAVLEWMGQCGFAYRAEVWRELVAPETGRRKSVCGSGEGMQGPCYGERRLRTAHGQLEDLVRATMRSLQLPPSGSEEQALQGAVAVARALARCMEDHTVLCLELGGADEAAGVFEKLRRAVGVWLPETKDARGYDSCVVDAKAVVGQGNDG